MTQTKTKYKDKTNTRTMTALHRHYLQVKKKNNYISHVTMTVKTMLTAMTKTVKKCCFVRAWTCHFATTMVAQLFILLLRRGSLPVWRSTIMITMIIIGFVIVIVKVENYDHDED